MKTHSVEVKLFHTDTHADAAMLFSVSRYSRENSTIKGLVAKISFKDKNVYHLDTEV